MPKCLVSTPDNFVFSKYLEVTYSDLNAANHLASDRVLPLAIEGQLSFFRHLGYDDVFIFDDLGLIMANAQTDFLSEAFHGNRLRIDMAVEFASDKAMDLVYSIFNETLQLETARVRARMLFFNYADRHVVPIPVLFRKRLNSVIDAQTSAAS